MAIDNDLSTPLLEVRLIIGDNSSTLISDATINALLVINSNNVNKTAIQSLQAIIADLAKQADQKVGDVELKASQLYNQYKDLLDKLLKDPAYALSPAVHILGGISKKENYKVKNNPDSRSINIEEGFYSKSTEDYTPYSFFSTTE